MIEFDDSGWGQCMKEGHTGAGVFSVSCPECKAEMEFSIVVTVGGLSPTDNREAVREELHNLIADWAAGCIPQPLQIVVSDDHGEEAIKELRDCLTRVHSLLLTLPLIDLGQGDTMQGKRLLVKIRNLITKYTPQENEEEKE